MNCTNCNRPSAEIHEIYYPSENKTEFVCGECLADLGFCIVCGGFIAGSEMDEQSGIDGVCYDCLNQANDEQIDWNFDFLP